MVYEKMKMNATVRNLYASTILELRALFANIIGRMSMAAKKKKIAAQFLIMIMSSILFCKSASADISISEQRKLAILSEASYATQTQRRFFYDPFDAKDVEIDGETYSPIKWKSSPTGFFSVAYENENTGEIIIVYRGTDGGNDVISDVGLPLVGSIQYTQALSFATEVISENRDAEVVFSGHSLGGSLAQYAAVSTARPSYTFNSAPVQKSILDKFSDVEIEEDHINFRITRDVVSALALGSTLQFGESVYIEDWNCIDCHRISYFLDHYNSELGIEAPPISLDSVENFPILVPIEVNDETSFAGSTVPQYGTIEQTIEFSAAPDSGNADLINEQVAVFVEEAEPETEPPVTTPLWAGRMSLTGRVNAGLNPATGVVGAMEASGDAPISEFILFNPETGTINTPLHGSQTSANIGHTFNHLIWGDWSGGSRSWTTSSYPVNQLSGFFVYGELTPPDARTTGTASYTGRLRGDIIANGNIEAGTAYGDFGLTANFGTGSLGGWLAFADTNSSNYAFVSDIENARIVRQGDRLTFSGDLSGEGITGGNIDGYFFGPNATELGGTYEVAGSDGNSSSSGILLGWETGTMPDRPDNPTSMNFPLYVSYSSTSGAIFDRGDDGIGKTPEMGDTLTLTIDGTPTRVTEVYDTTNDQFDYTSWGGWTGGAPSSPFNEGYWVAGQETPSSVIENLTGTATYSGDIRGDYVSAGTRHDATGNINLTADFSNDRITGDMMFHAQTGNGSVSAGTLGLQSDIRSDGSFFQSTSSHGFQGNFYGPNAEEAGGTAWLTTNDGSFNGVFRANQ